MNETAQETTAVTALLVEQVTEMVFTSLPEPVKESRPTYINVMKQGIVPNLRSVRMWASSISILLPANNN